MCVLLECNQRLVWVLLYQDIATSSFELKHAMSPSLGACKYPIFTSRRFHRLIYLFEFISNSDPYRNLSDQLQSQARTNVEMSTRGCIVLSLPKRAHVDWNWPISREIYLKLLKTGSLDNAIREFSLARRSWDMSHLISNARSWNNC